jgi:hypothetical protein
VPCTVGTNLQYVPCPEKRQEMEHVVANVRVLLGSVVVTDDRRYSLLEEDG